MGIDGRIAPPKRGFFVRPARRKSPAGGVTGQGIKGGLRLKK
jgi:hypothetical protein